MSLWPLLRIWARCIAAICLNLEFDLFEPRKNLIELIHHCDGQICVMCDSTVNTYIHRASILSEKAGVLLMVFLAIWFRNYIRHFFVSPCNEFPLHLYTPFQTKSNGKQRKRESTSLLYQCQSNQFNDTQKTSHMNLKCSPRIADKQILSSLSLLRALKGCFIVLFRFVPRRLVHEHSIALYLHFIRSLSLSLSSSSSNGVFTYLQYLIYNH